MDRRLTVGDAVILIAATALGVASIRLDLLLMVGDARHPYFWLPSSWFHPIQGFLLAEALGLISLRLRKSRPPRRRILRELGFAGCLGTWVGLCIALPAAWYDFLQTYDRHTSGRWILALARGPAIPAGVVSAWVGTALARRLGRPSDWVDWLGIAVGLAIVAAFLAGSVLLLIQAWAEA